MTTYTTNNISSAGYIVREFPNTINTVILQFRTPVDNHDAVDYYIITQEPIGTNRRETKFASRKFANFDPYVRWIDSRYFIISTGTRFGRKQQVCRDEDINWSQDLEFQHDIYRMPEYELISGGGNSKVPEHLTSIPDLYPGYSDTIYTYGSSLSYEIIPPEGRTRRSAYDVKPADGEGASSVDKPMVLDPQFCRIHSYWVRTTDKPYSRKLQDELHATYAIKGDRCSNACKVFKFTPENPRNPDYCDQEAVDDEKAANPVKSLVRVQDYLTPKSRPYHEAMTALLGNMLASAKLHGFVFGGYILGLIEHHAAYQADPVGTEYRPPNDVDVWFSGGETPDGRGCYSRNGIEGFVLRNIIDYLVASGRKYQYLHDADAEHLRLYGVAKLLIDDTYRFDLVCNVNNGCKFDSLADFSATNLYYKLGGDGQFKLRTECGGFNLEQVLGHIRAKELHPVVEFQKLGRFVHGQYEYDWYQKKFTSREQKMLAKGYSYPSGVVSLSSQYVPGMAEKLAKIKTY
jgi:hypothetical protein